jgi:hypothetical protein
MYAQHIPSQVQDFERHLQSQESVQLEYPKRIIDRYSLMSHGDAIPYFSRKRNAAEDYHILSFISISRLQLC